MNVFASSGNAVFPRLLCIALFTSSLAWVPDADAGAFSISPVRIHMSARERIVAVAFSNEGEFEVALQATLYTWSQAEDGTESLEPTEDLIVAPPILRLAPNARQVVRLALLRPADPLRQLTYRLIVREVPELTQPMDQTIQVPITLALSMPIFITPPKARRQLLCNVLRPEESTLGARCTNLGNAYAQVRSVQLFREGRALARFDGGAYILPGAGKFLQVQAGSPPSPGPAELEVHFDDGTDQSQAVTVP